MNKSTQKLLNEIEDNATKEFLRVYKLTNKSKLTKPQKLELCGFIHGWILSIVWQIELIKKEYDQTLVGKVKNYATRIFS